MLKMHTHVSNVVIEAYNIFNIFSANKFSSYKLYERSETNI